MEALLKHMKKGAPNRKYYCLRSIFNLIISMSQDSFSIANNQPIKKLNLDNNSNNNNNNNKQLKTLPKNSKSIPKGSVNNELASVRKTLVRVENEISELESSLNDLLALKQIFLHRMHEIEGYCIELLQLNLQCRFLS
jgi:predicted transcriptional regulator